MKDILQQIKKDAETGDADANMQLRFLGKA
jgi:hypothetical protein